MENFTLQVLIFLIAAILIVPIFQRLGFGSILGYLISGVIIGPAALGLVNDSTNIMHFSELGVVFLLFLIGLEIQPRKLWSMRKHLMGYGLLQVIITTLILFCLVSFFIADPTLSFSIAFALSLSSTAFAVQSLHEKNLFNTSFGRGSFAILLMQDLLAIPALALIPSIYRTFNKHAGASAPPTDDTGLWIKIAIVFAFFAILILLSRYVMRPLFRFIASTRSRELFTAITLLIVLGVAVITQQIGLSAALGTFLAGVLLADSEYRHELETNLEPFKGLLMGLFFIAVGMSVDVKLIAQHPVTLLGLTSIYLFIKAAIIYGIGLISKLGHQNSKMMAITVSQGGEFAFVIFATLNGLSSEIGSPLQYLTVVITLSLALNPLIALIDQLISKLKTKQSTEYDRIENEDPDVIIAGFGRFGQIFSRIFRAQGISFVAIDHDSEQIDLVRRFGNKVYYGDASRMDILETAGARKARFLILAIDDVELSLKTVRLVKSNFPQMRIFARARNRGHAFDLMELGITDIKRELFDSSVMFTLDFLIAFGYTKEKANRIVNRFKVHDEVMLREQFKVRQDDKSFISVSHQGTAQLAQVLNDDDLQTHIDLPQPEK